MSAFTAGTVVVGPRVVSPPVELARERVTLVGDAEPATRRELVHTQYAGEQELGDVMELIDSTLSEPYSIFTYRYFINTWPTLCILTRSYPVPGEEAAAGTELAGKLIGVIISKADVHRCSKVKRGYLAMLVVDKAYRKLRIGTKLAIMTVEEMARLKCIEAVLETEITNKGAMRLYERLGFIRQKRLPKYYLNGNDAYRLKLLIPQPEDSPELDEDNEMKLSTAEEEGSIDQQSSQRPNEPQQQQHQSQKQQEEADVAPTNNNSGR
jgi:N-alpha-acetyltransferase 30